MYGGYYLKGDISHFDAQFFHISPNEDKAINPQQRILLECAYEALENAGIRMDSIKGTNTAVYTAAFNTDYEQLLRRDPDNLPVYQSTRNALSILSNRISYFFDLKGPSITVDTACSSSVVPLHMACQNLRACESKQAIVGAANLMINPDRAIEMAWVGFFPRTDDVIPLTTVQKDTPAGEGFACLVLKTVKDALRDGDPIRAVIRETVTNQDGRTAGITLPSSDAQKSLIRSAYIRAGLNPLDTTYVEAHGTGTPAGDPVEAGAIAAVFGEGRPNCRPLYIGSVKTNVGHLESASGLAG